MNYIIVGLLLSIGWHIVKLIYEVAAELLFNRLHGARWYLIATGRISKTTEAQPGDIKTVKNHIGFM